MSKGPWRMGCGHLSSSGALCLLAFMAAWAVLLSGVSGRADEAPPEPARPPAQAATAPAATAADELSPNPKARAHVGPIAALAIDPGGDTVASCGKDGTIRLWSLPEGALMRVIQAHQGPVDAIGFLPARRQVLSASITDRTIKFWQLPGGGLAHTLTLPTANIYRASISPKAHFLAFLVGEEPAGYIVSVATGKAAPVSEFGGRRKSCIAWSAHDTAVGYAGDGSIVVGVLPTCRFRTVAKNDRQVTSLAFAPDGMLAACGEWYGGTGPTQASVGLWSMGSGALAKRIILPEETTTPKVAFAPNGKTLVSAGRTLQLLALPECTVLRVAQTNNDAGTRNRRVESLVISPDGARLVTGASDGTIVVWSLPDLEVKAVLSDPEVPPNK